MTRGIVVIHGMGEQKRGDFLKEIVNPLARYLESKGGKVDFEPEIALGASSFASSPAKVTLKIYGPGGAFAEEWHVREAHWAATFRPPTLQEMIRWGRAVVAPEAQAIARIFHDPLNTRMGIPGPSVAEGPASRPYPPDVERFYIFQNSILQMVTWFAHKAGRGLLTLVWLLLLTRGLPGPPSGVRRVPGVGRAISWLTRSVNLVANVLYPFVVQSLGDAKSFLDNPIAADAMRRPFEDALLEILQDKEMESITIIAHSLGAAVSYDSMTEGRAIDLYLRAHPEKRKAAASQRDRRITWITVGAALNRMYTLTAQEEVSHARERFRSPIASTLRRPEGAFSWLNLYARYDPIPAGHVEDGFRQCAQVTSAQFKERLVINGDSIFSDHTTYWKNDTLVWPRIVQAICDGQYPWARIQLTEPQNQDLIRQRTIRIARRNRRRLQVMAPLLLLAAAMVAVLAAAGLVVYGALSVAWWAYRQPSSLVFGLVEWLVARLRRLLAKG